MSPPSKLPQWIAVATAVLTVVTFGIAASTPPLSGPFCESQACFTYPYSGIETRFPRDYWWMLPAMLLMLFYVWLVACIYEFAPAAKKIFGLSGFAVAGLASLILLLDYYVQLAVIQPSLLKGETDGIALWTQYNPHGVFIALEELGYILMGVSYGCLAWVFTGPGKVERAIRWVLGAGFFATIGSLVYFLLAYGNEREYRFEVTVISIEWIVLLGASILLAVRFRRS
jgi:hypothetical protein